MARPKYDKYIIKDLKLPDSQQKANVEYSKWATRMAWLDDTIIKGALSITCSWYFKVPDADLPAHTHDYDEYIGFFGSNQQNPRYLGGEIEFWLEDEKYTLTESCLIFIPKGMKHCPLAIKRIDKPIFNFGLVSGKEYKLIPSG